MNNLIRRTTSSVVFALLIACSPAANKIVRTVVDLVFAKCVAEHPDASEPELQKICGYADDLKPVATELLAAHRAGAARARDAGAR